jgi:hypothetical protein
MYNRLPVGFTILFSNTALFVAYFPYFEKIKVGLCDHLAVCVSMNPPPPQ